MSQLTVDKVPEDAMVEVFKWLDPKSLKNAVLTCKQWKGFIERNIPWTLQTLHYEKHRGQEEWFELVLSSNRKFRNVTIDGLMWKSGSAGLDVNTLEIFGKHGEHIRELTLANSPLISATMWCQLLTTMPQLEKLKMKGVTALAIEEDASNIAENPTLKNLKTVELIGSRCDLLLYIESCKLKSLQISVGRFQPTPPREPLLNFLASQENLEELIYDDACLNLFETPVPVDFIPFRLKKLSLSASYRDIPQNFCENLMAFVKLHKDALEDLELKFELPSVFLKFIFTEFKQLKKLCIAESSLPQDSSFYEQLAVNTTVTSLEVIDMPCAPVLPDRPLMDFLKRLPNIEKLKLYSYSGSIIAHIAETMTKLKEITIALCDGQEFGGLKFRALESLRLEHLYASINWDTFTKGNSGIKELSIGWLHRPELLDLQSITQNLKELRKLTIEYRTLSCDKKFFDMIRKNCKELKSLNLNVKSLKVNIASIADIAGLRFRNY